MGERVVRRGIDGSTITEHVPDASCNHDRIEWTVETVTPQGSKVTFSGVGESPECAAADATFIVMQYEDQITQTIEKIKAEAVRRAGLAKES